VTTLRPIADFQIAPPPTWAAIPAVPQEGDWPLAVADRLCDNAAAHKKLAIGLMAAHQDLIGPDPHVMVAVWVPDPTSGNAQGVLTVDWMLPDPGTVLDRAYYRQSITRTPRPHLTVLEQHIDDLDLPAGPSVRERERVSRSSGRRFSRRETVFETVIYTVFPPGSTDALQLTFSTDALDLGDAMAEDADAALATLDILLGQPDAAT
jgi:hypothetical protein